MRTYEKNNNPKNYELPEWIDDLFLIFTLAYKHRWVSETDEIEIATKHIWAKQLQGYCINENTIKETAYECLRIFPSWPPTLGEFIDIALSKVRIKEKVDEMLSREECLILEKKSNPEIARKAIEQMRENLRKKGIAWRTPNQD